MPMPVVVALCNDLVEDKTTGLAVLYKLVERIGAVLEVIAVPKEGEGLVEAPKPQQFQPQGRPTLYGYAAWMRTTPEDVGREFVHVFRWVAPDGETYHAGEEMRFFFPEGEKTMRRFTLRIFGAPPIVHSGVAQLESAIRSAEDKGHWMTQRYPFIASVTLPEGVEKINRVEKVEAIDIGGDGHPPEPTSSA